MPPCRYLFTPPPPAPSDAPAALTAAASPSRKRARPSTAPAGVAVALGARSASQWTRAEVAALWGAFESVGVTAPAEAQALTQALSGACAARERCAALRRRSASACAALLAALLHRCAEMARESSAGHAAEALERTLQALEALPLAVEEATSSEAPGLVEILSWEAVGVNGKFAAAVCRAVEEQWRLFDLCCADVTTAAALLPEAFEDVRHASGCGVPRWWSAPHDSTALLQALRRHGTVSAPTAPPLALPSPVTRRGKTRCELCGGTRLSPFRLTNRSADGLRWYVPR